MTARTMDIHPAVAFGSVIAGASLIGPVGALLALPWLRSSKRSCRRFSSATRW
ncbi:MAG: AI-2E family transporter [Candidatus Microthrix sp.]|nr:hypothetical protein [Candidatus Microthrix sp.]MBK6440544.1 AI-2E family transporter [Candidatus Microthrix sp.]